MKRNEGVPSKKERDKVFMTHSKKKSIPVPIQGKAYSLDEMIVHAKEKVEANSKKYYDSGGMCINCGKEKGDQKTLRCESCNNYVASLISSLGKGGGFIGLGGGFIVKK